MGKHDARTYGRLWAEDYDLIFPGFDPAQIDLLANLAGDPPRALELAIGTGRLALPLRSAVWRCRASTSPPRWWPG